MTVLPGVEVAHRVVTAECRPCRLHCQAAPGADGVAALRAFRRDHPLTAGDRHGRGVPPGWRVLLSGPGALSQ